MPLKSENNSFPQNEKLKKQSDFLNVYKGKRLSGKSVIVYYLCGNAVTCRKIGFAVSKKVSKSAVVRNKIKRRLREIYRLNKSLLPEGVYLIIRTLPYAADVDFYELKKEIIDFFSTIASGRSCRPCNQSL